MRTIFAKAIRPRYCVGLYPLRGPTYEGVRRSLWQTFEEYGVPEGMLFDHGSPWWGPANVLGLTRLAVDLIEQGVRLYWSGIAHPQTQGKVERFFGTVGSAVWHRGGPPQFFEPWAGVLREIRHEYNHIRPHEALDMQVPAHRYRASQRALQAEPQASGSIRQAGNSSGSMPQDSCAGMAIFVSSARPCKVGQWGCWRWMFGCWCVTDTRIYVRWI